jgi:hypothetical protein
MTRGGATGPREATHACGGQEESKATAWQAAATAARWSGGSGVG